MLDMTIEKLDISIRVKNLLISSGIKEVSDLIRFNEKEMQRHRWFCSAARQAEFDDAVQKAHVLLK
jgi:DNA-directed RNA polymerase alpha subunit